MSAPGTGRATARSGDDTLVDRATTCFERWLGGDRAALDDLVEALTPLLWRTARATGLDTTSAEDVVQTVWMTLLRSAESIRDPRTVVKWLLTATRREAWRVSRRQRAEQHRTRGVFGVDAEEVMDLPAAPAPDETVLVDDRQRLLWRHVAALPERCRQLLGVIAFADRPDYAHLADALGMPVGSIGPTRGRCLAKLKTLLADDPRWEGER